MREPDFLRTPNGIECQRRRLWSFESQLSNRRKIWVECEVTVEDELTARGEVLAIRLRAPQEISQLTAEASCLSPEGERRLS